MSYRVDCVLSVFVEEKEKKEPMQSWVILYMYIYFIIIDLTFDLFILFGEVVYRWVFGEDRFWCNNVFTMRPWGVVLLLFKAYCYLERVIQVDPNDHWWLRFFHPDQISLILFGFEPAAPLRWAAALYPSVNTFLKLLFHSIPLQ